MDQISLQIPESERDVSHQKARCCPRIHLSGDCPVSDDVSVYSSAAECLEAALNTLSRALETNCDNPEVWSHYLSLFSRRGSREEVQEMCEMAVEHAPDYKVWWNVSPQISHLCSVLTCSSH